MDRFRRELRYLGSLLLLAGVAVAAPGIQSESLEAASLQLGALQAQAQYAPSALQGARAASRSAASCLVTAVQYTHGQQIRRADPCEFCLCLDGEMFCWWQECPPEAPGPCPSGQPYSLCGNSSATFEKRPSPVSHKPKKTSYRKTTVTSSTTTPKMPTTWKSGKLLMTLSNGTAPQSSSSGISQDNGRFDSLTTVASKVSKAEKKALKSTKVAKTKKFVSKTDKKNRQDIKLVQSYTTLAEYGSNSSTDNGADAGIKTGGYETQTIPFDDDRTKEHSTSGDTSSFEDSKSSLKSDDENRSGRPNSTASVPVVSKPGCLVMGTEYQVGQALPSTGSCLACRCSEGGSTGARVTCAPRGCAPMDSATLSEDTDSF